MGDDLHHGGPGWDATLPRDPEQPEHSSPERAGQWVAFYADLVEFETRILDVMRETMADLPEAERQMVQISNIEPLEKLIAEFDRRREMWTEAARRRRD